MNIKEIATTLAILGSGTLALSGCGKEQAPATEVPGGIDAPADAGAGTAGEAACAEGHTEEGHCAGEEGGAAGEEGGGEGEGSCSGEGEGEGEGEGSCSGEGE